MAPGCTAVGAPGGGACCIGTWAGFFFLIMTMARTATTTITSTTAIRIYIMLPAAPVPVVPFLSSFLTTTPMSQLSNPPSVFVDVKVVFVRPFGTFEVSHS